ncbi:hypothetical protein GSI_04726 [Ganoderma sinense ZZ0214-1]|uniref:Uncharacterized protein n=1 Tax=Ganoderma sinense ZZ0214-1 TaxID=1077348 RepID=A0A2G8SHN0_9APHY|nr:hypothetical protein GSI_04726 [Ganoderma sinense ZZ0214-1]
MYSCAFTGCSYTTMSKIAYGRHRKSCSHAVASISQALGKRKVETMEPALVKRARVEETITSSYVAPPPLPARPLSPPPPPSPPGLSTRGGRRVRLPKTYNDFLPSAKGVLPSQYDRMKPRPVAVDVPPPLPSTNATSVPPPPEKVYRTAADAFGIFREYARRPHRDPETNVSLEAVCDAPGLEKPAEQDAPKYASIAWITRSVAITVHPTSTTPDYGPFENASQFRLMDYFYGSSDSKSLDALDDLIAVIRSPGFSSEDLKGFSAKKAERALDIWVSPSGAFSAEDGWHEGSVKVPLPKTRAKYKSEDDVPKFNVSGVIYRRLLPLIKGVVQDAASRFSNVYHWLPHRKFWIAPQPTHVEPPNTTPPASGSTSAAPPTPPTPIRVYTDCYNSDAMLKADAEIRAKARVPGDAPSVEYVTLPLLFWSDATQLANFGSASLWPIYMYFGNLSKYVRGRPTEFTAHHLAYIPSLPDAIKDAYTTRYGRTPSEDILKFCKRDLFQQIWLLLLDDDFMHAYEHGILLMCGDGVLRRIFPRVFTYSADYPEKVLVAALRPLARCPCPRCLTPKGKVSEAGSKADMRRRMQGRKDSEALQKNIQTARGHLFKGYAITGARVDNWLKDESLIPVQSAFSKRFSSFDVNFYDILAPDLMHEFELGVWKAKGADVVEEFNSRMRRMPTFGRDRIRRFWHDVASRKRLAARDYEAFLITMMPAFEGLLDLPDDQTVADLLFELANWHALAKLRLHTTVTLDIFRAATGHMYDAIRRFAAKACPNYDTHELPSEAAARVRRAKASNPNVQPSTGRKPIAFNVHHTYKFHSLGDYPDYIERSGPTDNYNTQVGELEHRHVKRFYTRTNKIHYEMQIARKERKRSLLAAIREADPFQPLSQRKQERNIAKVAAAEVCSREPRAERQETPRAPSPSPPSDHHAISKFAHKTVDLHTWLDDHEDDPAIKDFMPLLFEHLTRRLLGREAEPEDGFSPPQLDGVHILNDRLYRHRTIRINHTSYDMRRDQDAVNPRTHADIMLLSSESDGHPFWYAHVLEIFHANVRYVGPGATYVNQKWQRIDFVWVRWFEIDTSYRAGFQHRRQHRLQFIDATDVDNTPFGFVDPDDIIQSAYLIPGFDHGSTTDLLGPSKLARRLADDDGDDDDYCYFYACMFAGRDIFMRHLGGGVGHAGIGIDVETSKQHAIRASRRGGRKKLAGARLANAGQGLASNSGRESSPGSAMESDGEVTMNVAPSDKIPDDANTSADKADTRVTSTSWGGWEDGRDLESDVDRESDDGDADEGEHESEGEEPDESGDGDAEREERVASDVDYGSDDDVFVDTVYAAEGFAPL